MTAKQIIRDRSSRKVRLREKRYLAKSPIDVETKMDTVGTMARDERPGGGDGRAWGLDWTWAGVW